MPAGQYTVADLIPDPNDFTHKYNTPIPPARQTEYEAWRRALPPNLQNQYDYDLQGAFLSNAHPSANLHLTDQFKKPNHPTFSDLSQYNGIDGYVGGHWTDNGYVPSVSNLQFRTRPQLEQYFADVEPGTKLLPMLPIPTPTGRNGQYRISDLVQQQPQQQTNIPPLTGPGGQQ